MTQAVGRREEEFVEVEAQEESPVNKHDLKEEDEENIQASMLLKQIKQGHIFEIEVLLKHIMHDQISEFS